MSEMIYKCRRCLKRPNETYREDPNEVLVICAECGTENWCLPVKGKVKAKKVSEVTEREVAESTLDEQGTKDAEFILRESLGMEHPEETESIPDEVVAAVNESPKSVTKEEAEKPLEAESVTEAVSEEEAEKKRLRARLAELEAKETEK